MSIYAITIPCFAQMLRSLSALLSKGETCARDRGYDPVILLESRLAPDMHNLARQVQYACVQAQEAVQRLTRQPLESLSPPEDMASAKALIERTLRILDTADVATVDAAAELQIAIELPNSITFDMTGSEYAVNWVTPQFYFHLVTAYNILRHNGVPLGKADYVQHMFAYLRQ
ncbi:DUF1993 domain-containing protein [Pseudomonas guariconensis]|uniref:DUF1993 domain-containing protein n=1 Tax=Pseudomonas TaxID=286 RepID=UPI001CE49A4C|nr:MULTISPECIES: DUF1993 domain-containing protein [Pseudomonas]MCO7643091.1 DUF1993 domain-containing protein [Pseudomonas sp. S 311-6]MCO7515266.1 DUF1993 domain-containing protein [Pseudomonas putida]MCO7567729.1 DUF1993 domain-containing protein [Pseudomonas mosselii]MCO7604274.1 DUF1993 domain-containing protein [Pseudomonas guariconensis]MCO7619143.1 DUF1993 domain-containing protein [Pseudomonas guariconensis]